MNLPETIQKLVDAQNRHDSDAFTANFSNEAVVYDEGEIHTGLEQIRQWNEKTGERYNTHMSPLEIIDSKDGDVVVVMNISGTFEGSPIHLKFNFKIDNGLITSLKIG